jgi:DNA-directed RNA polymerase subunit RPC12/RpoP
MTAEMRILKLACPSCGADLEISPEMEAFACGYCGSQQMVQRRGGTVALKLVTDAISKVQVGTDRTAAELAIQRLQKEIDALTIRRQQAIDAVTTVSKASDTSAGMFLLICGAADLLFAIVTGSEWDILAGLVLFTGLGAIIVYVAFRILGTGEAKVRGMKKQNVAPLDEAIAAIKAELDHHQQLVATPRPAASTGKTI